MSKRKTVSKKSNSEITLNDLISAKPDDETALPRKIEYIKKYSAFIRRGSHDLFLACWHLGSVLSPIRASMPHGNSKEVKDGSAISFNDWVEQNFSFVRLSAARWCDIFDYIKPDNKDFETMLYADALEFIRYKKAQEKSNDSQSEQKTDEQIIEEVKAKKEKKKKPLVLGSCVNNVKNSSQKLKDAASLYEKETKKLSAGNELELLESHLSIIFQANQQNADAAAAIAALIVKIAGSKSSHARNARKIVNELKNLTAQANKNLQKAGA